MGFEAQVLAERLVAYRFAGLLQVFEDVFTTGDRILVVFRFPTSEGVFDAVCFDRFLSHILPLI